eukprot:TRINITY_DN5693_c0_g2_i1.p1 TRINITY_DN5693_c0_g2~~TRINITY_DN5693_c0_g2_i1.p1  ORF type:complete len:600 (-),score=68.99 TRINITY_DN5693_c0_g2_i1:1959-3758(-)
MSKVLNGGNIDIFRRGHEVVLKKKDIVQRDENDELLQEEEEEELEELNEKIWTQFNKLQDEAGQWFSKLREMPVYGGNVAWEHFYHQAFQAFSNLWKYQLEHRVTLVQYGMQRWEIGDIASKIGQLYFNFYLRSGDFRFLLESHVFYSAIMQRQYYLETPLDAPFYCKKLRYHARFIIVAILLDRRQQAHQLLQELRALSQSYSLAFPNNLDIEDWDLYINDIANFLKANSFALSVDDFSLRINQNWSRINSLEWQPMISEVIMVGYYPNMVKMGDVFSVDTYRMWNAFEWQQTEETQASAYESANKMEECFPSPQKFIVSKPTVSKILAQVGAALETQAQDGGLIVTYFSIDSVEAGLEVVSRGQENEGAGGIPASSNEGCLLGLPRSSGGYLLPQAQADQVFLAEDLLPFTRRPLVLVVDSDMSSSFVALSKRLRGGGPYLCLASPPCIPSEVQQVSVDGKIFTAFLASPHVAVQRFFGVSDLSQEAVREVITLIEDVYVKWANAFQDYLVDDSASEEDRVWSPIAMDPFLCRLTLGLVLYNGLVTHHRKYGNSAEFRPQTYPRLPVVLHAECALVKAAVYSIATMFKKERHFISQK